MLSPLISMHRWSSVEWIVGDISVYWLICLLDSVRKLLFLYPAIARNPEQADSEYALSKMQFGIRKGRSTMEVIRTVVGAAETAYKNSRGKIVFGWWSP